MTVCIFHPDSLADQPQKIKPGAAFTAPPGYSFKPARP
jgi:hypothetical protein